MTGIAMFRNRPSQPKKAAEVSAAQQAAYTGENDDNVSVSTHKTQVSFTAETKSPNESFARGFEVNAGFGGHDSSDHSFSPSGWLTQEERIGGDGYDSCDDATRHSEMDTDIGSRYGDPSDDMSAHSDSVKTPSKSAADPGISSFRERPSQTKNDKVATPEKEKDTVPVGQLLQKEGAAYSTNGSLEDSNTSLLLGDVEMESGTIDKDDPITERNTIPEEDPTITSNDGQAMLNDPALSTTKPGVLGQEELQSEEDGNRARDEEKMESIPERKNHSTSTARATMAPEANNGTSIGSHRPFNQASRASGAPAARSTGTNGGPALNQNPRSNTINRSQYRSQNQSKSLSALRVGALPSTNHPRARQAASRMTAAGQAQGVVPPATKGMDLGNQKSKPMDRFVPGGTSNGQLSLPTNSGKRAIDLSGHSGLNTAAYPRKSRAPTSPVLNGVNARTTVPPAANGTSTTGSRLLGMQAGPKGTASTHRTQNQHTVPDKTSVAKPPATRNNTQGEGAPNHRPQPQPHDAQFQRKPAEATVQVKKIRPMGTPLEDARRFEEMHRTGDRVSRDFFDLMKIYQHDVTEGQISLADTLKTLLEMEATDVDTLAMVLEAEAKLDEYIEANGIDLPNVDGQL